MAEARFAPLRFDSADLPAADQYPTFASAMVNFDMHRKADGPFAAKAMVWRVGSLVISSVSADPITYDRSLDRIRSDRVDHIYLIFHVRGRLRADCGKGGFRCGPGSLLAIDMRQPCHMAVGSIEELSVGIPRWLILPRLDPIDPHGLSATGGMAALFGRTLKAVCQSLNNLAVDSAPTVERLILDLAVDAVREAASTAQTSSARELALEGRVRLYIDENLGEQLNVSSICRDLGVSRSSLYRAFEQHGGIVRFVQQRRLRRARTLLENPAEKRSIAALAEATGFSDKSHFARAFKRTFGVTAGALRREPPTPDVRPDGPDNAAARTFESWVHTLD